MKNTVVKYGLISGAILASITAVLTPLLCLSDHPVIPFDKSEYLGYSAMILAYLAVFFGIRTYRRDVGGGTITFGQAFKVGILITLVTCAVYVIGWEIVYWNFLPDFGERYAKHVVEALQAKGASAERVAAERAKMAQFAQLYKNPFVNVGMTFLEVFPVGLIVTLVSAGILRRKEPSGPQGAEAAA